MQPLLPRIRAGSGRRFGLPKRFWVLVGLLSLAAGSLVVRGWAQGPFPMVPGPRNPGPKVVFPENRQLRRLLRNAVQALEEKNYPEAVALLSRVLAHPEDSFYRLQKNAATYTSLKAAARELLIEMPPPGQEVFRLRFEGEARRLLRQGLQRNDPSLLAQAARRYFLTFSGARAMWHLARQHLDSGHTLAAAVLLDRMAQLPEQLHKQWEPDLSLLRAACWSAVGEEERARDVLARLQRSFPELELVAASGPVRLWELAPPARNAALAQLVRRNTMHVPPGRHWPYPGGEPGRTAPQAASLELVLRQWRAEFYDDYYDRTAPPGTYSDRGLSAVLNRVVARARQRGNCLVVGEPLILDDVVVVRTLTQLVALETETGRRLWEHARDDLILGMLARFDGRTPPPPSGEMPLPAPGSMDGSLDQLLRWQLYADRTYTTLSSDAQAVFCVERVPPRAPSRPWPPRPAGQVPARPHSAGGLWQIGDANVNRLAAYDLQTGKLLWQLGGHKEEKAPLAEHFFLGPPLPLGDMLYTLVEQRGEIRLLALQTFPGHRRPPRLVWTQPLGHAPSSSGLAIRASSGLSPTFAQGLLLCPTDAGMLVALDPVARQLQWGFVYQPQQTATRGRNRFFGPRPFRSTWLDPLVRVHQQRVLLTPRDEDQLYCLDLQSGQLLWAIPRGENRLLLAVDSEGILLQADRSLQRVDWQGQSRWFLRFSARGTSTGRALVTPDRIHVPLSDGTLLAVDRRSGQELPEATFRTRSAQDPFAAREQIELGSLIASGEVVLSMGVFGLERLENLRQLQARLARQLKEDSQDVETLLLAAAVYRRLRQWDRSLALLDRAYRLRPEAQTRQALVSVLLQALEADFPRYQKHVSRLRRLAGEPEQQARLLRVCAAGFQEHGQPERALELYLELLQLAQPGLQPQQVEQNHWARQEVWIVSQLRRLNEKLSPQQREQLGRRLNRYVQQFQGDPEQLRPVLELLGREDQLPQLRHRWLQRGSDATPAERLRRDYHLLRLAETDDPQLAGWATATLAREYRQLGLTDEAAWFYEQLQRRFADVECLDGKTGAQLAAELQPQEATYRLLHWNGWPQRALKLRRKLVHPKGVRGERQREFAFGPMEIFSSEPWSRQVRYQVEWGPGNHLVARNRFGRVLWAAHLVHPDTRQVLRTTSGTVVSISGHVLVLATADYLLALDIRGSQVVPPGEVLWIRPFATATSLVQANVAMKVTRYPWLQPVRVSHGPNAPPVVLRAVTAGNRVVFQQDDAVMALDLFTGRLLWKRTGFAPGRNLFADSRYVIAGPVTPPRPQGGDPSAAPYALLDARDGSLVDPRFRLPPGVSPVTVRGLAGLRYAKAEGRIELSRVHLVTGEVLWKRQLPADARLCLQWPYMAALDGRRNLTLWHAGTGKQVFRQSLPLPQNAAVREIDFWEHADAWLLVVENETPETKRRNPNLIRHLPHHQDLVGRKIHDGQLVVLDHHTGRLRWWREVKNLFLAPYQAPGHPLLVLGNSWVARRRLGPGRVQLQMVSDFFFLDKRTGKLLWDVQVNARGNPWFDLADMANPLARTIRWRNGVVTTTWEFDPQAPPPEGENTPLAPRTERSLQRPAPGPAPNPIPPGPGPNPLPAAPGAKPPASASGGNGSSSG